MTKPDLTNTAPADICKPFGYVRDNCGDGHVFQHAPFSESESLVHSTAEVYSRAQMLSALSASASMPDENGYATAFYEIASVLGIGARADTPENVFRNVMLPRIKLMAEVFGDKYCAECRKTKGAHPAARGSSPASLPDEQIEDEWARIRRTDDSWVSLPHRRLARWAFEKGSAAALASPKEEGT